MERERSRTEYVEVDASEAAELLSEEFGTSIKRLNEDPGRLLTRVDVGNDARAECGAGVVSRDGPGDHRILPTTGQLLWGRR
jgi:hypothetical protein